MLTVNNLRDRSANTNLITTNSVIGVATWRDIFPINSTWVSREQFGSPAANWTAVSYVENSPEWDPPQSGFGQAMFSYEFFSRTPIPQNTELSYGLNAYYFRNHFSLGTNVATRGAVKVSYLIDDGAVFYLNGVELFRYNMPAGAVTYDTFASASVDATAIVPFSAEYTITNFVSGTNIFSVEVHQQVGDGADANQTDVVFAAALRAAIAPNVFTPTRPRAKIVQNGNDVIVSWTDPTYRLQSSTGNLATWLNVSNGASLATSPYTTAAAGAKYFRLAK